MPNPQSASTEVYKMVNARNAVEVALNYSADMFEDEPPEEDDQTITPIRTSSDERDVVLVLDISGSMSGTPIKETRKAASKFIGTVLGQDARIGIVTYDDQAYRGSEFSVNKGMP